MNCPRCGNAMNHHADKADPRDAAPDGTVEQIYACPGCGASASRRQPKATADRQSQDDP